MATKAQPKKVATKAPTKVALRFWSEEEISDLTHMARDPKIPLDEIAEEFCRKYPKAHSADAVKQRVFKMRREGPLAAKHSHTMPKLGNAGEVQGPLALIVHGAVVNGTAEQLMKVLSSMKG